MWSTIKIKTKVSKRRVERKVSKKHKNLIKCKCRTCGKKKWSQHNKKTNKVLSLILINVIIWFFAWQSFESIKVRTMVFENPKVAVVEAIRSMPESGQTGSPVAEDIKEDATLAKQPLKQTSGSSTSTMLSPVRASDVEAKIRQAFAHSPEVAVAIAKAESSLDPSKPSSTDVTKDGHAFSWGLFQLNLTVTNINGVACNEAFEGRNYKAVVKDKKLYEKCVKLATDPDLNIQVAVKKYEGRGNYTAWGAYTNGSYLKHL